MIDVTKEKQSSLFYPTVSNEDKFYKLNTRIRRPVKAKPWFTRCRLVPFY